MRITVLAIIFLLLTPILSVVASDQSPADQVVRGVPSGPLAAADTSFPRLVNASRGGPSSDEVNPNEYISQEPAPMGIADYGVGPSGPYEYATNSSLGTAEIVSLSTVNATGDPGMTIQLNVNLQFSVNDRLYVYWIQDVASIETNSDLIQLVDNVWNFSSPLRSVMSASAVSGDGVVASDGNSSLYYDIPGDLPGNNVSLSLPATVQLEVDSHTDSSGQPVVDFSFNDGPGWQRYDTVTFLTAGKLTLPGFVVDGFKYNPLGIFYDSELILGGPGDGLQTTDVSSDVRLQLYYSNGDNFEMVSNAYNFGSDTAEGMNNTLSQWDHYQGSGQNIAEVQSGAGTLGRLYDSSQIGTINFRSAIASGTLYIVNSTDPSASPAEYPFVNGNVTVTLFPGEYTIRLYQGGAISDQTNITVDAGQHLSFKMPFGGASLTLSYSVADGGSGHYNSPPVLTYVRDGVQHSTVLTATPTTYLTDAGTSWSVTRTLSGSSGTERWQTDQQTNGTLSSFQAIQYVYFNQFLVSATYTLTGGGAVAAPHLNYTGFGEAVSLTLTNDSQLVWIDSGSQYSVPPILGASSSSTERWYDAHATQGTVDTPSTLSFDYYHQFLLVIINAGISSQWYNSSSMVQLSVPGISGRAAGYGQRITSYSVDDGSPTIVQPTTGAISISIRMDSSHQVSIASVEQYQVSLDASAAAALSSITPPTISGDDYWYDLGTPVSLVFNGVWARSGDTGQRLVSYSVDGNSSSVSTTGRVDVSIGPLSSPESVSGDATTQYHLTTESGSVASVTAPTIAGDGGWYDSGTQIAVTYYYSWNNASGQSRDNALSYSAGGGATTTLERSGAGTFPVRLTISAPENITIYSTAQYPLDVSGGHDVSLSVASPTGDAFYDAGSTLTATTDLTWGLVDNNDTRQHLVSFTLDSVTTNVTTGSSSEFTTPGLTIGGPTALAFNAATQDLVVLQFRDSTGTDTIVPSSVQIEQEGSAVLVAVPSTGVWLDNGTRFQIYGVEWESADVKPTGQTLQTVNWPVNQTVLDRVYDGSIVVKDYLGLPVSGAGVSVILANGTTIASTTGSNGSVALHEIPIGTYTVTVSYLGTTASVEGNAAVDATAQARLLVSYPVIGIAVALLAVVVVAASLVLTRRRHQAQPQSGNS